MRFMLNYASKSSGNLKSVFCTYCRSVLGSGFLGATHLHTHVIAVAPPVRLRQKSADESNVLCHRNQIREFAALQLWVQQNISLAGTLRSPLPTRASPVSLRRSILGLQALVMNEESDGIGHRSQLLLRELIV